MAATFESRANRVIRNVFPMIDEYEIITFRPNGNGQGMDILLPHWHGKIPDTARIIDLSSIQVILEALGVVFPTPGEGEAELLEGGSLDTVDLPATQFRPEGAPHVFFRRDGATGLDVAIRSFWFGAPEAEAYKTILVCTGVKQGTASADLQEACKLIGHVIDDIVAEPENGAAPLTVNFYPSNLNSLTQEALQGITWEWDFGDGNVEETDLPFATHTYVGAGTYTVTLTGRSICAGPIEIEKVDLITAT